MYNIIEEYQMMELIRTYLNGYDIRPLFLGGMVGTCVFDHVIEAALEVTSFGKIEIIEGIQDIIGLHKKIPLNNHHFYAEMFENAMIDVPKNTDTLEGFLRTDTCIEPLSIIKKDRINYPEIIIINDAHLIPDYFLLQFLKIPRKVILIVDPFDVNGEQFIQVPTIVDTLRKQSPLVAKTRMIYGVDTRAIDKSIKGTLDKIKMSKRAFGKIDDNQYVSNDPDVLAFGELKQKSSDIKRKQKFIVLDKHVIRSMAFPYEHKPSHDPVVVEGSLISIYSINKSSMYNSLKIHSSFMHLFGLISYDVNDRKANIHVKNANIINIDDAHKHRFRRIIFIKGNTTITQRQCYALLKSSNHISMVE